jgi:hypothetical protein
MNASASRCLNSHLHSHLQAHLHAFDSIFNQDKIMFERIRQGLRF